VGAAMGLKTIPTPVMVEEAEYDDWLSYGEM